MTPQLQRIQDRVLARSNMRTSARIARELGVTVAGLSWLARAVAAEDGHATQRGNEATKLVTDGFAQETGRTGFYSGHEGQPGYEFRLRYVTITDAGRELVRRARELGW